VCPNGLKIKIQRTIILPVISCGYETWSLTTKEEHRLMVSVDRTLGNIFGPKREEVNGDLRKLHNEEVNDLYFSQNIIHVMKLSRMRQVGNVVRTGKAMCTDGLGGESLGK